MDDNLSLFEQDSKDKPSQGLARIDVAKMEFLEPETISWQELFSGYDHLYAITYSSGISFVCELLNYFDSAEIIFGNDEVMSYQMHEIMAYQLKFIERLRKESSKYKSDLIGRIDSGTLRLWVAREKLSHEKLYLLEAHDGRKRVIMGSANMSRIAFSGRQRECVSYMDGDKAFEWYKTSFEQLKEDSTDNISINALTLANDSENVDRIPVAETIKVKKALVINTVTDSRDDIDFVLDVQALAKQFKPITPSPDKKGKIYLEPAKIVMVRKQAVAAKEQENELRSEQPQLVIDVDNHRVLLNGDELNLQPEDDLVRHDVDLFLEYMNGYKRFHGDVDSLQKRYFEFANWFFCSPFMAQMRDMAIRHNQIFLPYPVFGLVYGQSKAGKTSFLETLLKMMIGQKPKMMAKEFTRTNIEALKYAVQGAPIIVDDLTQIRYTNHAVETIKSDDFGINEHLTNYPAVVISANEDVKAVTQEIIRRTVICRVQAGLTNTEVMKSNVVRKVQGSIGTAFYREYLRQMMVVVPGLLEQLKDENEISSPDILAKSSIVICDILNKYTNGNMPAYMHPLSLDDYFGEKITGANAIKEIQRAWMTDKKSFTIVPKMNQLRYVAGQSYDADRILKELPENLEAHRSKDCIVMDLDAAKEYFGLLFRKHFWE